LGFITYAEQITADNPRRVETATTGTLTTPDIVTELKISLTNILNHTAI